MRPATAVPLLALAACAASADPPAWPLVRVHVEPSPDRALRLVPADARFAPRTLGPAGGSIVLPAGAWWVECEDGAPAVAVPAFENADGLSVPTRAAPPGDDEFATIPAGPASIGDRLGVGQPDERPVRIVDLPTYQLGRHEVTNAQYAAFLTANASAIDPDGCLDLRNRKCRIAARDDGTFVTDAPRLPAVTVSWKGAQAYCTWRSGLDPAHSYRLPTEDEWEKAARGPGSHVFSYGDVYTPGAANQESGQIAPVGTFPPNAWGLFDLTGNAFEWTADGEEGVDTAPRRYLRGGSFVLDGIFLRNSFRMLLRPTVRADDVGFRVLREPASRAEIPQADQDRSP